MQYACTLPLPLCTLLPSTPSLHLRSTCTLAFPITATYSHPRESTCTMVSPAHLPSYSHGYPATATYSHPASTCTNKERIEKPTSNHYTLTVTDRAKRTTRLYLTLPTLPYQPCLGELNEAFLSSPSPFPFPTISPYPITRVKEYSERQR